MWNEDNSKATNKVLTDQDLKKNQTGMSGGQCYACGAEFSVFKKEHGCKNCGFAFCSKCLHDKSVPVPKRDNARHRVCRRCFDVLTGVIRESSTEQKFDVPEAYLKRLAALKAREAEGLNKPAHSSGKSKGVPEHLRKLSPPDREIALRLEKLKEDKRDQVTDQEIQARLARLRGDNHIPEQRPVYKPPDRRSETEQVNDLISQLSEEVDIDSLRPDPASDVQARLAIFKGENIQNESKTAIDGYNLNREVTDSNPGNDLNKVDKIGSMAATHSLDSQNIRAATPGWTASSSDDQSQLAEMQQLMAQAARELELDAQKSLRQILQDKELAARLTKNQQEEAASRDRELADSDVDNTTQIGHSALEEDEEEDEEDVAAAKLVQRYLEEARLDSVTRDKNLADIDKLSSEKQGTDKSRSSGMSDVKPSNLKPSPTESDYEEDDELPYCCICTENAAIRCRDCDMDLYCNRCFRKCHQEPGMTDHHTLPYTAPKGYS